MINQLNNNVFSDIQLNTHYNQTSKETGLEVDIQLQKFCQKMFNNSYDDVMFVVM